MKVQIIATVILSLLSIKIPLTAGRTFKTNIKKIFKKNNKVHIQPKPFNQTFLHQACAKKNNNDLIIKTLKNYSKSTFTHKACDNGNKKNVRYLIKNNANINAKNKWGQTPLHRACLNENLEIAKYLIENKAKIESKDNAGRTPLHTACSSGNLEIVRYLIKNNANINSKNERDETPLHAACYQKKNKKIIYYLITNGSDVNAENINGDTPLHIAYKYGNYKNINQYFFEYGANVNAKNNKQKTLLHYACSEGLKDTVEHLVEHGAKLEAKDYINETPFNRASTWYKTNTKFLSEEGIILQKNQKNIRNYLKTIIDQNSKYRNRILKITSQTNEQNIKQIKTNIIEEINNAINDNNVSIHLKQVLLNTLSKVYRNGKNKKNPSITKQKIKNILGKIYFNTKFFTNHNFKEGIKIAAEYNLEDCLGNSIIKACTLFCKDKDLVENTLSTALTTNSKIYNHINIKRLIIILKHLGYLKLRNKEAYKQIFKRLCLLSIMKKVKIKKTNIPNELCAQIVGYIGF